MCLRHNAVYRFTFSAVRSGIWDIDGMATREAQANSANLNIRILVLIDLLWLSTCQLKGIDLSSCQLVCLSAKWNWLVILSARLLGNQKNTCQLFFNLNLIRFTTLSLYVFTVFPAAVMELDGAKEKVVWASLHR